MKKSIDFKFFFYIIILLSFLIPQIALANCTSTYPDAICVDGCDPQAVVDTDPALCPGTDQVCCKLVPEPGQAAQPGIILQVPLLNYAVSANIAEYLKYVYKAALYIIVPIIIVIMIGAGILWIISGGDKQLVTKAKERIKYGFIGLAIALFSYVILSTVGGTLLTVFNPPKIEYIEAIEIIPDNTFQEIVRSSQPAQPSPTQPSPRGPTPSAPLTVDRVDEAMARRVAQNAGVPLCVTKTILAKESGGKFNAINHDEDVRDKGRGTTKSRHRFVESGKKFSGATFTATTDVNVPIFNDDKPACSNRDDLCLDWRFSHGLGVGQITPLPGGFCNGPGTRRTADGICHTARELMNPELNLNISMRMVKAASKNGTDWRNGFKRYNGGGSMAEAYANSAMKIFNNCCATTGGC